jgi:uncharacterized membrane protein YccF (DUF307 family)
MISFLGNLLWIILGGGLVIFLEYVLGGVVLCITIVGIPFGVQCFKIAMLGLLPFGKDVSSTPDGMGCLAIVMNVIWIVPFGIIVAISHVILAAYLAVTIIGIPFAIQHLKLARLAFTPFGLVVRERV